MQRRPTWLNCSEVWTVHGHGVHEFGFKFKKRSGHWRVFSRLLSSILHYRYRRLISGDVIPLGLTCIANIKVLECIF